jgi:hypothetical protein
VLLAVAAWWSRPAGVVAIVAFYGVYRFVLSVAEARLQRRMPSSSRATATSVAALCGEIVGIGVFGLWAFGGTGLVAVVVLLAALLLLAVLGRRAPRS